MTGIEHYYIFVISGVLLNIIPGNDTIYILSRSISQGKEAGIISVLGISTGTLCHTIAVSLGLSVILQTSPLAYQLIKYIGVLYLFYLGIKMLVYKQNMIKPTSETKSFSEIKKVYFQGLLTNILNPKVALFFLSFLPQFVNIQVNNTPLPFILLGLTFVVTGTLWCLILVYCASFMTNKFRSNPKTARILYKLNGLIFFVLGISILLKN